MDKIKKAYVDFRFRTRDSNSDSDFKCELKEALDLPDNTVCYVGDISIPHTWRTIEYHNNKFYIIFKMKYLNGFEMAYKYDPSILTLPEGNYTGANLAAGTQDLLNGFAVTFNVEVVYQPARGTVSIEAKSEGMDSHNKFYIPSDFGIVAWESNIVDAGWPWYNREGVLQTVEVNNLQSISMVYYETQIRLRLIQKQNTTDHMKAALLIYSMFLMCIYIVLICVISIVSGCGEKTRLLKRTLFQIVPVM